MLIIASISEREKEIKKAIKEKDRKLMRKIVLKKVQEGANCLDLCFSKEEELFWIIEALEGIDIPLSLDTHNRPLLIKALRRAKIFLINSFYPDRENLKFYLRLASEFRVSLVILSVLQGKINMDLESRVSLSCSAIEFFKREKFPLNKLFLDLVILPFKYYPQYIWFPLLLASQIKKIFPSVKFIAGLDNFTYKEPSPILTKFIYYLIFPFADAVITSKVRCVKFLVTAGKAIKDF